MAAQYKVTLQAPAPVGEVRVKYLYVFAADTKAGYRKARKKAEAKLLKEGFADYKCTRVECVG